MASCDRLRAVWGDTSPVDSGHHNFQRPLLALGVVMLGGALVQHFFEGVPIPYTAMCLIYGALLGALVLFSPDFTLQ